MADNYDFNAKELQDQAELNRQQIDRDFPENVVARMRERNNENIREKRKNSLLYQTYYDDNGNFRPKRFLTTFNNKPIVPTMSRNSNRRNSNRKNSSKKSKGGRKRKSGRKTKKNGW
jgi:hypothetical protein